MTTKISTTNIQDTALTTLLGPKIASIVYPGTETATDTNGGETINLTGTGLQTGGQLSVNGGDNTKFDIAAGVGYIIDNTDPTDPVVTKIEFGPFTNQTVTDLATSPRSFVGIDIKGNICIKI